MITNFKQFCFQHDISLLIPILIGMVFIFWGLRAKSDTQRRNISLMLAGLIVLIRAIRYIMDIYFGVFEWADLFSLHICHIDLILLVICLIKPNKALFNFCFLVGIPIALSVALFPGSNHPAPGIPRAMFFIMSHMMLIMGALYLAIALHMKPTFKSFMGIAAVGNLCLVPLYFINAILHTNFLYIMEAPKGTVIEAFDKLLGWPGYVLALDALALLLMLLMLGIGQLLWKSKN